MSGGKGDKKAPTLKIKIIKLYQASTIVSDKPASTTHESDSTINIKLLNSAIQKDKTNKKVWIWIGNMFIQLPIEKANKSLNKGFFSFNMDEMNFYWYYLFHFVITCYCIN